jgi:hypothetical protein
VLTSISRKSLYALKNIQSHISSSDLAFQIRIINYYHGRKLVIMLAGQYISMRVNNSLLASHPEHKEGLVEKLFHHKHHQDGGGQEQQKSNRTQAGKPQQKEGEFNKLEDDVAKDKNEFKDYIKEDENIEAEGDKYGGLM